MLCRVHSYRIYEVYLGLDQVLGSTVVADYVGPRSGLYSSSRLLLALRPNKGQMCFRAGEVPAGHFWVQGLGL